jgi:hypothetical protein
MSTAFFDTRRSLCSKYVLMGLILAQATVSCSPSKKLFSTDNAKTKQANVIATSDGGEFVIWSEKVGALQWSFDAEPTNAICFLTSYLSKGQIEAWKKKEEPLLAAYKTLKKQKNQETRKKFFASFKKDIIASGRFQNPFKEAEMDRLWPWMDREATGQLKDFEVILRHFGNFKSPILKDQGVNHPINEIGFREFLETKMSEPSSKLATLRSQPLPEPVSGMTPEEFNKGSKNTDMTFLSIGTGTIFALIAASGGAGLSGPLVPVFLLSMPFMMAGRSVWEGFNRHKTLSAQKAVITAARAEELKSLEAQLAPQKVLFESLKAGKEVVSETDAAEAENMSKKLNAEIESLVSEFVTSGANEEQVFQEWYFHSRDLTDPKLAQNQQEFFDKASYFKNTKCPQNAGDDKSGASTSLNTYFMVPANWM